MEIFVCKFNMLKKCKRKKAKKNQKEVRIKTKKTSKKAKHTKVYFAFFNSNPNDTASYAHVYQHDVRAKQTKVCDAKRAGVSCPSIIITKEVRYENIELQQRVSGSVFTCPALRAVLPCYILP